MKFSRDSGCCILHGIPCPQLRELRLNILYFRQYFRTKIIFAKVFPWWDFSRDDVQSSTAMSWEGGSVLVIRYYKGTSPLLRTEVRVNGWYSSVTDFVCREETTPKRLTGESFKMATLYTREEYSYHTGGISFHMCEI